MIQDIEPKRLANEYSGKTPGKGSRLMAFQENQILVKKGETADFVPYEMLQAWCTRCGAKLPDMVYLFSVGETKYFLTDLPEKFLLWLTENAFLESESVPGYEWISMFEMRSRRPKEQIFAVATAWHLYVWYRDNRFCGRCGQTLVHSEKLRMLKCPDCGNMVFPKIAPAVIVGVTNGERILMTKYAGRAYKRYALIAGFTEIGETAEQTVAREVMEETGVRVKNIRYYKSQPWGFDSNLLLGYFCELDGDDTIHMDTEELSVAEWVDYRDIPDDTEGLSLTREMMIYFRDSRRKLHEEM
ncbi:MAG: NAD(+) diphosphatase [Roseburia sp.]|nr:NAD(+) diphosphatase [Roseburia sp.]